MDAARQYCEDVLAGREVAGAHVKAACERHLRDLAEGSKRGLSWDAEAADRIERFCEGYLTLDGGQWTGQPMRLFPWQRFLLRSLFGWKRADGYRRFRTVYFEGGRGAGKSPVAAAIALYCLLADGEQRSQGFVLASTKEQAAIVFTYLLAMAERNPTLAARTYKVGGDDHPYRLVAKRDGGMVARLASSNQSGGQSGYAPSLIVVDEMHEMRSRTVLDALEMGRKHRRQPITFITTNSGSGIGGVCHTEHGYAIDVAHGRVEAEEYLGLVYAVDKDDKPFEDEACWPKANPSIVHGGPPGIDYIRERVDKAKGMPSQQAVVARWNFGVWTDAEDPWIDLDAWYACETEDFPSDEELSAYPCVIGLDLSRRSDLTAAAIVWDGGDRVYLRATAWTPGDSIRARAEQDGAAYPEWAEKGFLRLVPGKVIHYNFVIDWLRGVMDEQQVLGVAYDPQMIRDLEFEMDAVGMTASRAEGMGELWLVPHPQSFTGGWRTADEEDGSIRLAMPRSIEAIEELILSGQLCAEFSPVLRSAVLGMVAIEDASGNRRLSKTKSLVRIDAGIAAVQAVGLLAALRRRNGGQMGEFDFRSMFA